MQGLLRSVCIGVLFIADATLAAVPRITSPKIVMAIYSGVRRDAVIELRDVRRQLQRRGFLSIGIAPKLVIGHAKIELRDVAVLEESVSRLASSIKVPPQALEISGLDLVLTEQSLRLMSGPVLPRADGSWSFGTGRVVVGGVTNSVTAASFEPGVAFTIHWAQPDGRSGSLRFPLENKEKARSNPP